MFHSLVNRFYSTLVYMSIRTNPFPYALFTKKLLTVLLLALEIITARKKREPPTGM